MLASQDVMRLDNRARMNTPGKAAGNWAWRVGDVSVSNAPRQPHGDESALSLQSCPQSKRNEGCVLRTFCGPSCLVAGPL